MTVRADCGGCCGDALCSLPSTRTTRLFAAWHGAASRSRSTHTTSLQISTMGRGRTCARTQCVPSETNAHITTALSSRLSGGGCGDGGGDVTVAVATPLPAVRGRKLGSLLDCWPTWWGGRSSGLSRASFSRSRPRLCGVSSSAMSSTSRQARAARNLLDEPIRQ